MTRGLRKIGSLERLGYRPGARNERRTNAAARAAAIEAMTDEQKEKLGQEHALHNADMAQWRKDFDQHGPARAGQMLVDRKAARGTDKIADFYARRMVEGDTNMNHDNLEGAAVDHIARATADLDPTRFHLANCIMNCGTRIYHGDDFQILHGDEFYCAECAKAEAAE